MSAVTIGCQMSSIGQVSLVTGSAAHRDLSPSLPASISHRNKTSLIVIVMYWDQSFFKSVALKGKKGLLLIVSHSCHSQCECGFLQKAVSLFLLLVMVVMTAVAGARLASSHSELASAGSGRTQDNEDFPESAIIRQTQSSLGSGSHIYLQ